MAGGGDEPFSEKYLTAIKLGTDPQSPGYWGNRPVRPASGGDGGLWPAGAAGDKLTRRFSEREVMNLHTWLNQITDAQMPDSNWNYFAIMVQLGFKCAGLPYDPRAIYRRFAMMEAYYLGDGWYSDGPGRPKDYYISMALHFYGLIYATLSGDEKGRRCYASVPVSSPKILFTGSRRRRVGTVWPEPHLSLRDGRFLSAVAFSGLNVFSPGIVKGIVLRHLRWWQRQPMTDRDGILTLGFTYPNP